jgi:hypothetical protein
MRARHIIPVIAVALAACSSAPPTRLGEPMSSTNPMQRFYQECAKVPTPVTVLPESAISGQGTR